MMQLIILEIKPAPGNWGGFLWKATSTHFVAQDMPYKLSIFLWYKL